MAAGAGVVAGGGWRSAFECFLLKRDMAGWEWGEQNDEKDEMEKKAEENKEIRGQKRRRERARTRAALLGNGRLHLVGVPI